MDTGLTLFNSLLPAPTNADGDEIKSGWESQSEFAPSLLTRLADRATTANNELGDHEPIVELSRSEPVYRVSL